MCVYRAGPGHCFLLVHGSMPPAAIFLFYKMEIIVAIPCGISRLKWDEVGEVVLTFNIRMFTWSYIPTSWATHDECHTDSWGKQKQRSHISVTWSSRSVCFLCYKGSVWGWGHLVLLEYGFCQKPIQVKKLPLNPQALPRGTLEPKMNKNPKRT